MKYKNLKSFAHNFTHSFVSYENHFDGVFIIEELRNVVRKMNGEVLSIYWLPSNNPISIKLSQRALKSLEYYNTWLPKLAKQHKIELSAISELRTDIYRKPNHQIEVMACLTDDRGNEYQQSVQL
ncbi:hypothetical protein [Alkalimarinus sediminis]|uniref:Uncharacterized protein n=1 Tax=Alkalimarinus sediminis TaxID=1632866 RepID=A0A9E8HH24_9ALTE|nr:hypothetical protein [Alkalimarinus sediminis]UZW74535.1 hypothetical protein NNL22_16150 [Alkalimarinus sediminis]